MYTGQIEKKYNNEKYTCTASKITPMSKRVIKLSNTN